ncbi:MAG: excinuclease ABC subunit UvrC [Candidatus Diapherotrites archaeon]|nr:excinuclease ABC subunit UvrC [Candidatus Diapherotrites archaeon]
MANSLVTEQLKELPSRPGVYLMRDARANILYVGKAANLRQRVRSYFQTGQKLSPKLEHLVAKVSDLDFFVTNSEEEAIVLELNLIKRHRPYYNMQLKDDKNFPYLKIDLNEDWPRVQITRRLEEDGARYFGPFASARSVRQALKAIRGIFPFRSCNKTFTSRETRPCLEYYLGRCPAPCTGAIDKKEYLRLIKQVVLFLEGKQDRVLRELQNLMEAAAEAQDFEQAARIRDRLQAVDSVLAWQKMAVRVRGNQDVIALAQDKDQAFAQILFIRNSRLIGREGFIMQGTHDESPELIMTSFVKQFYNSAPNIPPLILLQHPLEDTAIIENWLQGKKGAKVHLQVPRRGNKKQLVGTAAENARQGLAQLKIKQLATPQTLSTALKEIQQELKLSHSPQRMEGYDISNIQGAAAVGSMVVFEDGRSRPSHYRRFRIKTITGANDYAMLQEVIRRRFHKAGKRADNNSDWAIMPDLVLIDGGKGQLNAVLKVMRELNINVPIIGLAKENEEIFVPQSPRPIVLPRHSPGLRLLERLRDEAHRFALGYHKKIRHRETFTSTLDSIPGIGPHRKRALLRRFGSIQAIEAASLEELVGTQGITRSLAQKIKENL